MSLLEKSIGEELNLIQELYTGLQEQREEDYIKEAKSYKPIVLKDEEGRMLQRELDLPFKLSNDLVLNPPPVKKPITVDDILSEYLLANSSDKSLVDHITNLSKKTDNKYELLAEAIKYKARNKIGVLDEFIGGFKSSLYQTFADFGLLGKVVANKINNLVTGENEPVKIGDTIKGLLQKAEENAPSVSHLSDATKSFKNFTHFAAGGLGNVASFFVPIFGLEATVGKGLTGIATRLLIKDTVAKEAETLTAKLVAEGMSEQAAKKLATEEATKYALEKVSEDRLGKLALKAVSKAPSAAYLVGAETGETLSNQMQSGKPINLTKALTGGVIAGALEYAPYEYLTGRLGKIIKGEVVSEVSKDIPFLKRLGLRGYNAAKEGIKAGIFEGLTEGLQSLTERYFGNLDIANSEAIREYIDSAAIGAISGGSMGAAGGIFKRIVNTSNLDDELKETTKTDDVPTAKENIDIKSLQELDAEREATLGKISEVSDYINNMNEGATPEQVAPEEVTKEETPTEPVNVKNKEDLINELKSSSLGEILNNNEQLGEVLATDKAKDEAVKNIENRLIKKKFGRITNEDGVFKHKPFKDKDVEITAENPVEFLYKLDEFYSDESATEDMSKSVVKRRKTIIAKTIAEVIDKTQQVQQQEDIIPEQQQEEVKTLSNEEEAIKKEETVDNTEKGKETKSVADEIIKTNAFEDIRDLNEENAPDKIINKVINYASSIESELDTLNEKDINKETLDKYGEALNKLYGELHELTTQSEEYSSGINEDFNTAWDILENINYRVDELSNNIETKTKEEEVKQPEIKESEIAQNNENKISVPDTFKDFVDAESTIGNLSNKILNIVDNSGKITDKEKEQYIDQLTKAKGALEDLYMKHNTPEAEGYYNDLSDELDALYYHIDSMETTKEESTTTTEQAQVTEEKSKGGLFNELENLVNNKDNKFNIIETEKGKVTNEFLITDKKTNKVKLGLTKEHIANIKRNPVNFRFYIDKMKTEVAKYLSDNFDKDNKIPLAKEEAKRLFGDIAKIEKKYKKELENINARIQDNRHLLIAKLDEEVAKGELSKDTGNILKDYLYSIKRKVNVELKKDENEGFISKTNKNPEIVVSPKTAAYSFMHEMGHYLTLNLFTADELSKAYDIYYDSLKSNKPNPSILKEVFESIANDYTQITKKNDLDFLREHAGHYDTFAEFLTEASTAFAMHKLSQYHINLEGEVKSAITKKLESIFGKKLYKVLSFIGDTISKVVRKVYAIGRVRGKVYTQKGKGEYVSKDLADLFSTTIFNFSKETNKDENAFKLKGVENLNIKLSDKELKEVNKDVSELTLKDFEVSRKFIDEVHDELTVKEPVISRVGESTKRKAPVFKKPETKLFKEKSKELEQAVKDMTQWVRKIAGADINKMEQVVFAIDTIKQNLSVLNNVYTKQHLRDYIETAFKVAYKNRVEESLIADTVERTYKGKSYKFVYNRNLTPKGKDFLRIFKAENANLYLAVNSETLTEDIYTRISALNSTKSLYDSLNNEIDKVIMGYEVGAKDTVRLSKEEIQVDELKEKYGVSDEKIEELLRKEKSSKKKKLNQARIITDEVNLEARRRLTMEIKRELANKPLEDFNFVDFLLFRRYSPKRAETYSGKTKKIVKSEINNLKDILNTSHIETIKIDDTFTKMAFMKYLQSNGVNIEKLSDEQIKEYFNKMRGELRDTLRERLVSKAKEVAIEIGINKELFSGKIITNDNSNIKKYLEKVRETLRIAYKGLIEMHDKDFNRLIYGKPYPFSILSTQNLMDALHVIARAEAFSDIITKFYNIFASSAERSVVKYLKTNNKNRVQALVGTSKQMTLTKIRNQYLKLLDLFKYNEEYPYVKHLNETVRNIVDIVTTMKRFYLNSFSGAYLPMEDMITGTSEFFVDTSSFLVDTKYQKFSEGSLKRKSEKLLEDKEFINEAKRHIYRINNYLNKTIELTGKKEYIDEFNKILKYNYLHIDTIDELVDKAKEFNEGGNILDMVAEYMSMVSAEVERRTLLPVELSVSSRANITFLKKRFNRFAITPKELEHIIRRTIKYMRQLYLSDASASMGAILSKFANTLHVPTSKVSEEMIKAATGESSRFFEMGSVDEQAKKEELKRRFDYIAKDFFKNVINAAFNKSYLEKKGLLLATDKKADKVKVIIKSETDGKGNVLKKEVKEMTKKEYAEYLRDTIISSFEKIDGSEPTLRKFVYDVVTSSDSKYDAFKKALKKTNIKGEALVSRIENYKEEKEGKKPKMPYKTENTFIKDIVKAYNEGGSDDLFLLAMDIFSRVDKEKVYKEYLNNTVKYVTTKVFKHLSKELKKIDNAILEKIRDPKFIKEQFQDAEWYDAFKHRSETIVEDMPKDTFFGMVSEPIELRPEEKAQITETYGEALYKITRMLEAITKGKSGVLKLEIGNDITKDLSREKLEKIYMNAYGLSKEEVSSMSEKELRSIAGRIRIEEVDGKVSAIIGASLLNTSDGLFKTAMHEVFHFLQFGKFFTVKELKFMKDYFGDKHGIKWYEHAAEAFAFYSLNRQAKLAIKEPLLRTAFKKVKDLLTRVRNVMKGYGFVSTEKIFSDILSGKLYERKLNQFSTEEAFSVWLAQQLLKVKNITDFRIENAFIHDPEHLEAEQVINNSKPDIKTFLEEKKRILQHRGLRAFLQKAVIGDMKGAYNWVMDMFFRGAFPRLRSKFFAKANELMSRAMYIPTAAVNFAQKDLLDITKELTKKELDLYGKILITRDIINNLEQRLQTEDELKEQFFNAYQSLDDVKAHNAYLEGIANDKIKRALEKREKVLENIFEQLRNSSIEYFKKGSPNAKTYFHRMMLANYKLRNRSIIPYQMKLNFKTFLVGRTHATAPYVTDYILSEYDALSQMYSTILQDKILGQLAEEYDLQKNKEEFVEVAIKKFLPASAKEKGGIKDIAKFFAPDMKEKYLKGTKWYNYSVYELVNYDVPYTVITLKKSKYKEIKEGGSTTITKDDVRKTRGFANINRYMILPDEIADTMNELFVSTQNISKFDSAIKTFNNMFKKFLILNPMTAPKYMTNNATGDLDKLAATGAIGIWKYVPSSFRIAKDYFNYMSGHTKKSGLTKEEIKLMEDAIEKGIVNSGLTVAEIPEIATNNAFNEFLGVYNDSLTMKYWEKVGRYNNIRESVLRLATYRYLLDAIKDGRADKIKSWATNWNVYQGLKDNPEMLAARVARDLYGDYANISPAGQWIRSHLIPFYSWIEINFGSYVRLISNSIKEGYGTGNVFKAMTNLAVRVGLIHTFYMAIAIWNISNYPDDWEEALDANNGQLHLILGKNSDGTLNTIRLQGAWSDFLSYFGMEGLPQYIAGAYKKDDPHYLFMKLKRDFAKTPTAAFNKIVQGAMPITKSVIESAAKISFFPDITNPRPVRSRLDPILRVLSLKKITDQFRDLPERPSERGFWNSLTHIASSTLSRKVDPEEARYFMAKDLAKDFLVANKLSDGRYNTSTSPRADASYLFKKSLMYGDFQTAEKYLARYFQLGGTMKDMKKSLKSAHPLDAIPVKYREIFLKSLTINDRRKVEEAIRWYERIYLRHIKIPSGIYYSLIRRAKALARAKGIIKVNKSPYDKALVF